MRRTGWLPIHRWLSLATVLLAVAWFASGCSAGSYNQLVQRYLFRNPAQAGASAFVSDAPDSPENHLLVEGDDGNLYVASLDGKQRFALTSDASFQRIYSQPTWSADGSHVAWSRLDGDGSALVTSKFDGSEEVALKVPFLPFYINWSPAGDQLAYLSNWQVVDEPSIALRLVDVGPDEDRVTTLVDGVPLYFSWAPDGSQMLTHVSGERVELQTVDGKQTSIVLTGSAFSAPQWSTSGDRLIYAAGNGVTQQLLVSDLVGQPVKALTTYDGSVNFVESPDARRVAYVLTEKAAGSATLGPPFVVDTESLRTIQVTERPVLAFYWSPDGQKLAFVTLDTLNGRLALRWNVWDGAKTTEYAIFAPSHTYLDTYLPFFDQYAQSHRIWSPASDAFVFAGALDNDKRGIWLQKLGAGEDPVMVMPGEFASWSPR
jgi:TolB protein